MERKTIGTAAVAASLVAVVAVSTWWAAQSSLQSQRHELAITAYIDCLNRYAAAKGSGKLSGLEPLPSGSEVCGSRSRE